MNELFQILKASIQTLADLKPAITELENLPYFKVIAIPGSIGIAILAIKNIPKIIEWIKARKHF